MRAPCEGVEHCERAHVVCCFTLMHMSLLQFFVLLLIAKVLTQGFFLRVDQQGASSTASMRFLHFILAASVHVSPHAIITSELHI